MGFTLDSKNEFHVRVSTILRDEGIAWLTTVDSAGAPQPNPVWFQWDDDGSIIIFSQPNTPKLKNIARNPHVSINSNILEGGSIVVFSGSAEIIDRSAVSPATLEAYFAKYAKPIANELKTTREAFGADYSETIRLTPTKLRGW